ncbi:hypothetical protein B0H63DRAFT_444978 [Podospora didyma]|uniref:Voltage-gated hydrogen channel 1 n=1 Tax=Podospora didyma TaxID=330526 RepID=A0AAE0P7Y7_9PEZI|nr:hypothetical protein B0H63DRAFT_444978 [Podospora didyma]
MADVDDNQPLLGVNRPNQSDNTFQSKYDRRKSQTRDLLSSKVKHYIILGLVALDVTAILADIFIALLSCDLDLEQESWVWKAREALHVVGLVFSSLFVLELLVTFWAFGIQFFHDWFHCFDAFVIVTSFVVDTVTRGDVELIASLVIMLRLWRLVKIIEELSVAASERMEDIEGKVVELERENSDLKLQIEALRNEHWDQSPAAS